MEEVATLIYTICQIVTNFHFTIVRDQWNSSPPVVEQELEEKLKQNRLDVGSSLLRDDGVDLSEGELEGGGEEVSVPTGSLTHQQLQNTEKPGQEY